MNVTRISVSSRLYTSTRSLVDITVRAASVSFGFALAVRSSLKKANPFSQIEWVEDVIVPTAINRQSGVMLRLLQLCAVVGVK
jgi:hypothetical protein